MGVKISELNETNELKNGCCFPIVQDGVTKKVRFETLKNLVKESSVNGKDGKDGASAYELACKYGYVGTEEQWIQSLSSGDDSGNVDLQNQIDELESNLIYKIDEGTCYTENPGSTIRDGILPPSLNVMEWANGIYKFSGFTNLIGLPNNEQAGRLEHFNLKRWKGNHNPFSATWGIRVSIFYNENGAIYKRLTKSSFEAGNGWVDSGWIKILDENDLSDLQTDFTDLQTDVNTLETRVDAIADNTNMMHYQSSVESFVPGMGITVVSSGLNQPTLMIVNRVGEHFTITYNNGYSILGNRKPYISKNTGEIGFLDNSGNPMSFTIQFFGSQNGTYKESINVYNSDIEIKEGLSTFVLGDTGCVNFSNKIELLEMNVQTAELAGLRAQDEVLALANKLVSKGILTNDEIPPIIIA